MNTKPTTRNQRAAEPVRHEPRQRTADGNQNLVRFQRYLESRGCPVRLAAPRPSDIRWID